MVQKIYIDLASVSTREQFFEIFASHFSFPSYFGNNWDAFFECMYSLDPSIALSQDIKQPVTGVHLIFQSFDLFERVFPEDELAIFHSILVDLSANKEYRWDHLSFTFEITYSEGYIW
jgi:RNAse (barnase) inhibitor barstar